MAEPTFSIFGAIGPQAAEGTVDPTIAGLGTGTETTAGTIAPEDGLILGDPESGIGETGWDLGLERGLREKSDLAGFAAQLSDFLRVEVPTFGVAWAARNHGRAASGPPVNADATLDKGYNALYAACGFKEEDIATGTGRQLVPEPVNQSGLGGILGIASAKLWIFEAASGKCLTVVLKDVSGNLSGSYPPGSVPIHSADFSGAKLESYSDAEDLPLFDFKTWASISTPIVENAVNRWPVATIRGYSAFEFTSDTQRESIDDSNADGGQRTRQTGRRITVTQTLFADDSDLKYELDQLSATDLTAISEQSFGIGSPMSGTDPVLAHRISFRPETTGPISPEQVGSSGAWQLAHKCVADPADPTQPQEFVILLV